MKWNPQDIDIYLQAKEYVDTAIIPLLPVTFGHEMKQAAAMTEFITLLTGQLEKQFKGRLMLLPGFSYLRTVEDNKLISDLQVWEEELQSQGFNHVFYLTSDLVWNSFQDQLTGSVIWIPSIPIEKMQQSDRMAIIDSQVNQMVSLFTRKWDK